ncbi:hypothetical protein BJV78DRAFT_190965 [Lactifluus subvellereus]|nr:hypothetical protein BJV78DRAFT_190965 [Lactifluus subvellereus]
MPPQKARLERILMVLIVYVLVFSAWHIYGYLVQAYESRWPRHAVATCVDHARWAPFGPHQVPGQPEAFQMHAWFTLPTGDLETLFLLSRDRHASGIVYFVESESAGGTDVEVEVQAFYESEGALRERTICSLRRSQGEHGIGVLAAPTHLNAPDKDNLTLTLEITVWLPQPRSGADVVFVPRLETDLSRFQHVIGDLHTHRFGQVSLSSTSAPIGADLDFITGKTGIIVSSRYTRGNFDGPPPLEPEIVGKFSPISGHESETGGSRRAIAPLPNGAGYYAQAPESAPDPDLRSHDAFSDLYLQPAYGGSFELSTCDSTSHRGYEN